MEECLYKVIILNKQSTHSAVLLLPMCHTHVCVNKISVVWMYEMTASISDGTGLPKTCNTVYEGWNFNSGNYLFTTDTK
jgi:hypothetical protein